jgi:head-tail adaptor
MIAPPSIGVRPHRVLLQTIGPHVPTDDGGYVDSWIDLSPRAMFSRIEPATAVDIERVFAQSAVVSAASHVVTLPYHPGITTKSRIIFNGRVFSVTGVATPDERNTTTICACTEAVE